MTVVSGGGDGPILHGLAKKMLLCSWRCFSVLGGVTVLALDAGQHLGIGIVRHRKSASSGLCMMFLELIPTKIDIWTNIERVHILNILWIVGYKTNIEHVHAACLYFDDVLLPY